MEKFLCKKKEDARVRKTVSRRKLGKLEIRLKKITKEQVPLSHVIKDRDIRKITEARAYTAKLKAKGQVKLFRKNLYSLLDQYSVADISKATKIPYYKVNRMLTWKRKIPLELMYTWKLPQSVREEVADFFLSSLISYDLPDMRYCNKWFMQMSVKEAYDVYKMNLTNERHCVAISTFILMLFVLFLSFPIICYWRLYGLGRNRSLSDYQNILIFFCTCVQLNLL